MKFAPKAYTDPYRYLDTRETSDTVKKLEAIVQGKTRNDLLEVNIVDIIYANI